VPRSILCLHCEWRTIQIGKRTALAGGCAEVDLDMVGTVDVLGADVVEIPSYARTAFAWPRRRPRRFVNRGRCGRAVARTSSNTPRRAARVLREVKHGATRMGRHGCPVGRGSGAWQAHGAQGREAACRLMNRMRPPTPIGGPPGDRALVRCSATVPADLGAPVADRPFARRRRRPGGDLFALC